MSQLFSGKYSLGLKSRIDARIAPDLTSWLHRFASLGLKSRITAVLSFRQVEWSACGRSLPLRYRIRFLFSLPQSRTVPPAEDRCRYDDASDSNFRRRKVERPACGRSLPLRCCIRFQFSSPQSRIAVLRAAIIVLQVVQGYCFKKYCHRLGHVSQGCQ